MLWPRFILHLVTLTILTPCCVAENRGIDLESAAVVVQDKLTLGTFRALLIGNDDYQDPGHYWQSLRTAVTGARAMGELLKSRYGFTDVVLLENAKRRDLLYALGDLSRKVQRGDSVLVYYAGHGFLESDSQRGYWVPVDAHSTDVSSYIRHSIIRDEMNIIASKAQHTLLIADSCFSGSLLRSDVRGLRQDSAVERYYWKVAAKKSVQIITAGGIEFVDDSFQNSGHSPFTFFLLAELTNNHKPMMTLSELSNNVEKAVANSTDQVPENGVLQGAGDELGEFIFQHDTGGNFSDSETVKLPSSQNVGSAPEAALPAGRRAAMIPFPML